jgi:hypothetical protein
MQQCYTLAFASIDSKRRFCRFCSHLFTILPLLLYPAVSIAFLFLLSKAVSSHSSLSVFITCSLFWVKSARTRFGMQRDGPCWSDRWVSLLWLWQAYPRILAPALKTLVVPCCVVCSFLRFWVWKLFRRGRFHSASLRGLLIFLLLLRTSFWTRFGVWVGISILLWMKPNARSRRPASIHYHVTYY